MKLKKLASLVLAGAMVLGLAGIATPALAATSTSTTVTLTVENDASYTITIPTTLSVSNAGWNALESIKAEGTSFPIGKKLTLTANSANGWALKSGDNSVGYTLKAAQGETNGTNSWTFSAAEVRSGKTVTPGIDVADYSSAAAGTYTDTVTFTATIVDIPVTGVSLNKTSTTLTEGGEETLTATVAPNDAVQTVTWASDNTSVATVDSSGKVTAVAAGTANITATSSADSSKTASCAVTVSATAYTVTVNTATNGSVSASATNAEAGSEITLNVTPATGYEIDTLKYSDGTNEVNISNNKFTMPAANVTVTATFKKINYTVTVSSGITNGTVTANKTTANYQDEVTLTVTPASNYTLDTLTVTDGNSSAVTVSDNKFTMPASNVTVTATFKAAAQTLSKLTVSASGNPAIYYVSGETWAEAIDNHATENSNWHYNNGKTVYYETEGRDLSIKPGIHVSSSDEIDATKSYELGW